jgi:hypothetical protein
MAHKTDIRFLDLPQREEQAVQALRLQKSVLDERDKRGALSPEEQVTLKRIGEVLVHYDAANPPGAAKTELANPLYVGTRDAFNENPGLLGKELRNHDDEGVLVGHGLDYTDVVKVALVLGLLAADETPAPRVIVKPHPAALLAGGGGPAAIIASDPTDPARAAFSKAFFAAVGEMHGVLPLARLVLSMLEEEGDNNGRRMPSGEVNIVEFANVLRCLRSKGVDEREPQLRRRINECLDTLQRVGDDRPLSDIQIALPDLNQISDYQIQAENVRLMGAMICAAMLDELRVFPVVDRLVEMSQNGTLAIGRGKAGEMLYRYWKETPNRISEAERRNFYAITIGIPGGEANGMTNREFNDLWMRFVSSVSSLVRQKTIDRLLQQSIPAAIGQQQVRKAARDLAFNLSGHGYGMALYAAIELQSEIKKIIDLLSHHDILSAFGARDMWQVIDQVATLELGGARNSARYRTLATCGAIITAWLANNVARYNRATSRQIIDLVAVTSDDPPTAGNKATSEPLDYDLVNACELWLADTATPDERIEQLAREPREAPVMTSRPVQIPSIAREMLQQAGVPGLGLGARM